MTEINRALITNTAAKCSVNPSPDGEQDSYRFQSVATSGTNLADTKSDAAMATSIAPAKSMNVQIPDAPAILNHRISATCVPNFVDDETTRVMPATINAASDGRGFGGAYVPARLGLPR